MACIAWERREMFRHYLHPKLNNGPCHVKRYFLTCAASECPEQLTHTHSLISLRCLYDVSTDPWVFIELKVKAVTRLCRCLGDKCSLGAHTQDHFLTSRFICYFLTKS